MSKNMFRTIAWNNIRKNHRFYVPFLLTVVLIVAMFCNITSISQNPAFTERSSVEQVLGFGVTIIALFAVIFIFYTNSFLMKRRKKELGLYHILGMEKRHVAKVLVWETLILAAIGILGGIAGGLLLDRLMFLVILKIYRYPVDVAYQIDPMVIGKTLLLFAFIFVMVLCSNIHQIKKSSAVELLNSAKTGEREPKAKWLFAIAGVICIGSGYYLSITTDNIVEALTFLFIAIILVMIGTYSLFMAGSIAVLKLLKKNKKYYYQTNHFVAVSGMLYRMKQNAVGLANIGILSTGVLLVISTTVSLYAGMKDILDTRNPSEIHLDYDDSNAQENVALEALVWDLAETEGVELTDYQAYQKMDVTVSYEEGRLGEMSSQDVTGIEQIAAISVITADTYETLTGERLNLGDHEVGVFSKKGELADCFTLFGEEYRVTERLASFPISHYFAGLVPYWFNLVVGSEEELQYMDELQQAFYGSSASGLEFHIYFDVAGGEEEAISYYDKLREELHKQEVKLPQITCRYYERDDAYVTFGSMLFLGIYLGALFLMATVLIIYYKQIIEGYEDRERYVIMRKVGMDKKEIRRSIRTQVLVMFFMPLCTALIHCLAAFPLMTRILQAFNMNNASLFAGVTALVAAIFAVGYICVYALTARTYYHIVS